jgi:esterase/lipase/1-acyl-sn-glycerol-3-phosphate acyltransferase
MRLGTYRATGVVLTALKKLLGVKLSFSGTENVVDRPTLFVANHFTRMETFLIPYVIYEAARRPVRSLGYHTLFKGLIGGYFRAMGGMATNDPRRNRTIIGELMTGRHDWVIYPEGALIKNKKTVHRGRLRLERPDREGPPHTGAAVLALKAEMARRRYLQAYQDRDLRRIEYYEETYGLTGPADVCPRPIVMSPVTLTFYPMRPSHNVVNRLAKFIVHDLDPRLEEELQVEGSILLADTEIQAHFGRPIDVGEYLGRMTGLVRRVAGVFSESSGHELFLRSQARRLTTACMRTIYNNLEVNLDHLFCYGLRVLGREEVPGDDLRRALYLTITEVSRLRDVRLHPTLRNGITALLTGAPVPALDDVVRLARRQRILQQADGTYRVDSRKLRERHDFHLIRLQNMVQVIGNEVEPVGPVVEAVRRQFGLSAAQLRKRASAALRERDLRVYEAEYAAEFRAGESRPMEVGAPYFLEGRGERAAVVLVHGYLAAPQQMRDLGAHLNARGCTVYAVRLAGHGTAPHHLTAVTWHDWLESVARGYAVARQHSRTVILAGFSLGGVLALLLASHQVEDCAGVIAINPPMRLRDPRAPLVAPLVRWNGAMRRLGLAAGHLRRLNDDTESPDINYTTDYLHGVLELRDGVEECRRRLGRVKAPLLVIQSDADPLVAPRGARALLARAGSTDKALVEIPSDRHVVVCGEAGTAVCEHVAGFIGRLTEDRARPAGEPSPEPAPPVAGDRAA